ncbi:MAG TPA: hypothetical protein VLG44_02300 [Chlamydiales bacterium]|nr:hypothetical protein [Chlamydiales bacterium]
MKGFPKFLVVLGRIFISLLFIIIGLYLIIHWREAERTLTAGLNLWHSHTLPTGKINHFFSGLLLWVPFLLIIGVIFSLLGGLLLFFGGKVRFAAFLLILVVIPATLFYHPFWFVEGDKLMQTSAFFKDIAILGGLLYVLAVGGKKKQPVKAPAPPSAPPPHTHK